MTSVAASSIPNLATIAGMVQDPTSDLLYIASSNGYVFTWNEVTQSVVSTIDVGRPLTSIDISADGKTLAVGEYSGTLDEYGDSPTTAVGLISLSTHGVQTLTLGQPGGSEGGVWSLAFDSAGDLLVSDDGQWVPWRFIPAGSQSFGSATVSGSSSLSSASYTEVTADHRYVLVLEGDITGAPVELYDTVAGKVIAQATGYSLGTYGFNQGNGDINDQVGLIADLVGNEVMILDFSLNHVAGPGTTDSIIGAHFSNNGSQLYLWDSTANSILIYNTTTWQQTGSIALASGTSTIEYEGGLSAPAGRMSVSADGRYLTLITQTGFDTIDLTNPNVVTQHGDGLGGTLTGTSSSNNFIVARGSNNFVGTGSDNTVTFDFAYADYSISSQADGSLVVSSPAAGEGPDRLTDIQTLQFADATAHVTTAGLLIDTSVAGAAALAGNKGPDMAGIEVIDSAANVVAGLDTLQSLVASGALGKISLTDSGSPTLSINALQLTSDAAALNAISTSYAVSVAAPPGSVTLAGLASHGTIFTLPGNASQYTIASDGSGGVIVSGNGVTDHFTNVTALQFADYTDIVARTPGGSGAVTSGNITELYGAALGREPDVAGLSFYTAQLAANPNLSLTTLASYFLASPEYTSNPAHDYAMTNAGDSQFITDCYQNLLNRTPSSSEVNWYLTNVINPTLYGLTPGSAAYVAAEASAHAAVVAYFSQSPEFLADVQVTAANPTSAQHWLVLA